MKHVIFSVIFVIGIWSALGSETYDTSHDNIDVEALVADKDRLQAHVDCFRDLKPCDEISAHFKKDFPEILATACAKCNPRQKHIVRRLLEALKKDLPESYQGLAEANDPENKWFPALAAAVADA